MESPGSLKFTDPMGEAPGRFCTLINIGHTRGIEHVASADTLAFDYGRLLDPVARYGQGVAFNNGAATLYPPRGKGWRLTRTRP